MNTDENNQAGGAQPQEGAVEGNQAETIAVPKAEYDKLNQTIGSMKRELKDLKKPKEEALPKETTQNQPDSRLIEETYLAARGVTADEEIDLALTTAKKWQMSVKQLMNDSDFQAKLEKHRTQKANELATSQVKGGSGKSDAKNTLEHWIAAGRPPTPSDIPNSKVRQDIVSKMVQSSRAKPIKFYND